MAQHHRWTTKNPIPRSLLDKAGLWSKAAALCGLKRADWIRMTLDTRAIDIVSASHRSPLLLAPGTAIWALTSEGKWRLRQMAAGQEEVLVVTRIEGVPPYVDPSCEAWVVTWVGHGQHFVVPFGSLVWPPGRKVEGLSSVTWLQWLMGDAAQAEGPRSPTCDSGPASSAPASASSDCPASPSSSSPSASPAAPASPPPPPPSPPPGL